MSKGIEGLECCLGWVVISLKLGSSEVWKFGFIRYLCTILSAKDRLGYRAPCIKEGCTHDQMNGMEPCKFEESWTRVEDPLG